LTTGLLFASLATMADNPQPKLPVPVVPDRKDNSQNDAVNVTGNVFEGVITSYLKGNEQFKVEVPQLAPFERNCVWAAGAMSELLGFNFNYAPPIGSKVLVYTPDEHHGYIIGCSPTANLNDNYGVARKGTSGGRGEAKTTYYNQSKYFEHLRQSWHRDGDEKFSVTNDRNSGSAPPVDLVEGEIDMTNLMGVGLQMMRHFSILKGGEMAKVEACLLDDMVRIISHTFRHFSAFGDYKIYNDGGRLNVVWDGTASDWEAWGHAKPGIERSKVHPSADKVADIEVESDNLENKARWRFSSYIGFLGDFINLFVTDQLDAGPKEEHMSRSGKGRIHVNEDGSILAQTVNDIILERVCRIPVPLQKKREDHPEGDGHLTNKELPEPTDQEPIKSWDWNASGGVDKTFWCVYQLRDYGRWFSNYYSKARFQQLKEDWEVPPEGDVPLPEKVHSGEIDKITANTNISPDTADVYSTIRLWRDGSISLNDGYENSVVMSRTGINVSSATNLQLEAAGSVNIVAGRDFNVVARNSADISAIKGGVSIRGENFIQQYSKGGILIESEGRMAAPSVWSTDDMDKPDAHQYDPSKVGGICIWSKNSSMRLISKFDMGLRCEYGTQFFYGMRQLWRCKNIMSFNDQLVLAGGVAFLKGILWADQILVPKLYIDNDYESIFEHPGHVPGTNASDGGERIGGPPPEVFEDITTMMDGFVSRKWAGKFKYRTREEFATLEDDAKSNQAIYESITNQGLRMQAENRMLKPGDMYMTWNPPEDGHISGRRSPWPGKGKLHWAMPATHNGVDKLWEPTTTNEFQNVGMELNLEAMELNRLPQ
jgi:hypothetical protein